MVGLAMTPYTIPRDIVRAVSGQASTKKEFHVLHKVNATFRPGTMTLVLSPPGHGKTSFLKAVAGHIPSSKLTGSVRYSGKTADEMGAAGINQALLAAYVDQLDLHIPFLTVTETMNFAW